MAVKYFAISLDCTNFAENPAMAAGRKTRRTETGRELQRQINDKQDMLMRRIIALMMMVGLTLIASAQTDVMSVDDAITIFKSGKKATADATLSKQGYRYKGVSTLLHKDYCWAKNVELSKDFLPESYGKGNSSVFMMATDGKSAFLYVYNQRAFAGLQAQVKKKGYEVQKQKDGSLLCTHDALPTLTFMQLQMPYPFCMVVTS